jgi:hypothetical protein
MQEHNTQTKQTKHQTPNTNYHKKKTGLAARPLQAWQRARYRLGSAPATGLGAHPLQAWQRTRYRLGGAPATGLGARPPQAWQRTRYRLGGGYVPGLGVTMKQKNKPRPKRGEVCSQGVVTAPRCPGSG